MRIYGRPLNTVYNGVVTYNWPHSRNYDLHTFYRALTYNRPHSSSGNTAESTAPHNHKVSPKSTDPVHLYSLYSYLQNVNTVLLDGSTVFTFCR